MFLSQDAGLQFPDEFELGAVHPQIGTPVLAGHNSEAKGFGTRIVSQPRLEDGTTYRPPGSPEKDRTSDSGRMWYSHLSTRLVSPAGI